MTSTSSSANKTEQLLRQTRRHFPQLEDKTVEIALIEKGGSDRKFYRLQTSPEHSLILIEYNLAREENRHYAHIAEFLAAHGIRAPRIYFHDPDEGLIWIEDLGAADLWSFRSEPWPRRRQFYLAALEEVARLHGLPLAAGEMIRPHLQPAFDAPLYAWEQQYFFENCLGHAFAVPEKLRTELAALPALAEIAAQLAALPRVLVHRDFQSQNIIMRDGRAHLIDFQGMRPGLLHYDIASLLYDPYVELSAAERAELFSSYREMRERAGTPLGSDGEEVMHLCAMQRLLQALGAYGYLGLVNGNTNFLAHIPPALASLRAIVGHIPGLDKLRDTLSRLPPVPRATDGKNDG